MYYLIRKLIKINKQLNIALYIDEIYDNHINYENINKTLIIFLQNMK